MKNRIKFRFKGKEKMFAQADSGMWSFAKLNFGMLRIDLKSREVVGLGRCKKKQDHSSDPVLSERKMGFEPTTCSLGSCRSAN